MYLYVSSIRKKSSSLSGSLTLKNFISPHMIREIGGCIRKNYPPPGCKNGRVVKGVTFCKPFRMRVDPVEIGRGLSDKAGADELVFLDITAFG